MLRESVRHATAARVAVHCTGGEQQPEGAFGGWLPRVGIRHHRGRSVLAAVCSPRIPQDVRRPLSVAEVETILKAAKLSRYPERDTEMVVTALDCGLRLNELRELQIDDVDVAEMSLTVRAATGKEQSHAAGKDRTRDGAHYRPVHQGLPRGAPQRQANALSREQRTHEDHWRHRTSLPAHLAEERERLALRG